MESCTDTTSRSRSGAVLADAPQGQTTYVDGDVRITDDIINNEGAAWRDPSEIGQLTTIARGNLSPDQIYRTGSLSTKPVNF